MGHRKVALALAATAILAACGADVTTTDEYLEVASQRDRLEDELTSAQERRDELDATVEAQQSEIDALTGERDAALDEVEELRLTYDDEIRAELQTAFDAEVARACEDAKADVDASIAGLVEYDGDWDPIATRADLVQAVTDCAAGERAKTVEEREAERLAACTPVDVDAVVKDPDAVEGDCHVLHVVIWQYDSRTGPCSFLGAMSDRAHEYRHQYGEDAAFTAGDACSDLEGIDADDHVKVWATGGGPYRYDTAAGGTNEIPMWSIEKVELVRKA